MVRRLRVQLIATGALAAVLGAIGTGTLAWVVLVVLASAVGASWAAGRLIGGVLRSPPPRGLAEPRSQPPGGTAR